MTADHASGGSSATTLLLVRHGEVAGIEPPRFRGRADPALDEDGLQHATALASYVAFIWPVSRIWVSPRERCRQTAEPLATELNIAVEQRRELDDFDYGDWTWVTHEEARSRQPDLFSCWREHPELMRFPGGESLQDLLVRAADALRAISECEGECVAFVTHDSVIRAMLLQLTGLPLSFYHQLTISPCGVSEVVLEKRFARLVRINETAHIRLVGDEGEVRGRALAPPPRSGQ